MGSVFNTRFLSDSRGPEFESPIEARKRYLSLRQMMDLGKQRQAQMQEAQRKAQWELEDRQRAEAVRNLLSTNPNATWQDIAKLDLPTAIKLETERRQMETAQSGLATAKLTQSAAERKAQTEKQQQVADVLYGVRNIQDPGQRQAAMDEATMMDLMRPEAQRLGLGKIGEVTPLAPNEQQFRANYAAAYTPDKLQSLLSAEAEAAHKTATRPFELSKAKADATKEAIALSKQQLELADHYLGLVTAQPSQNAWDKFYGSLPDEARGQLSPMFSPLELKKASAMVQTGQQRQQAETAELTRAETERHHRAMETGGVGDIAAADLTPDALNMMADNFATKGIMPPLGMGKAATELRRKIINRAAERNPDLAGNQAAYTANLQSLTSLQKQRDAIGAFEQTAMKNIDLFLKTVKPIIDTGSPWLNQPFRTAVRTGAGDPHFLAFQAARRVAVNEIAKITSNPNLSGALSDSARHEVESFIPENATAKEIVAVMNILKQDVGNRVQSMDEQIGAIKNRISPRASRDEIPNPIVDSVKTTTVKMRAPNGQVKDIPAGQVQYYESRGAKRVQ